MMELDTTISALAALAQETRLKAFRALMAAGAEGLPAGHIAEEVGVPPNFLTSHLSILVKSGLVTVQRDGRRMIYRAEIEAVRDLMSSLVETCCYGHPEVCQTLAPLSQLAELAVSPQQDG